MFLGEVRAWSILDSFVIAPGWGTSSSIGSGSCVLKSIECREPKLCPTLG
jgi:hypothetical protein